MSIQVIKQGNKPEWAVVPYETYLQLVEKAEMLEDIRDYDSTKAALDRGELETIPSEVVYAILDGENPIRIWREYRGLSQHFVAEKAGISIPYLSQLETNKRDGSIDVLSALARVLNTALDDIVTNNEFGRENTSIKDKKEDIRKIFNSFESGMPKLELLLEKGSSKKGREILSKQTGVDEIRILEWVNLADLFRVRGIGAEYADLLEAAGVDSMIKLVKCQADVLAEKMVEINEVKKLVRRVPTLQMVEGWISEAKTLPRIIKTA